MSAHSTHCYQGKYYATSCKYEDPNCPERAIKLPQGVVKPAPERIVAVQIAGDKALVLGYPETNQDEETGHNCDAMGCPSAAAHTLYAVPLLTEVPTSQVEQSKIGEPKLYRCRACGHHGPSVEVCDKCGFHGCRFEVLPSATSQANDDAEKIASYLEHRSLDYPDDIFLNDSVTPDGIAGTTLRKMLPRLAKEIREGLWRGL